MTLGHDRAGTVVRQSLENHADIVISTMNAEYTRPTHAIERLQDDVSVFCQKITD